MSEQNESFLEKKKIDEELETIINAIIEKLDELLDINKRDDVFVTVNLSKEAGGVLSASIEVQISTSRKTLFGPDEIASRILDEIKKTLEVKVRELRFKVNHSGDVFKGEEDINRNTSSS